MMVLPATRDKAMSLDKLTMMVAGCLSIRKEVEDERCVRELTNGLVIYVVLNF
jgi:hypothetical protein